MNVLWPDGQCLPPLMRRAAVNTKLAREAKRGWSRLSLEKRGGGEIFSHSQEITGNAPFIVTYRCEDCGGVRFLFHIMQGDKDLLRPKMWFMEKEPCLKVSNKRITS